MQRKIHLFWFIIGFFLAFQVFMLTRQVMVMSAKLEAFQRDSEQFAISTAQVVGQLILHDAVAEDWQSVQKTLVSFSRIGDHDHFQVVDLDGLILADSNVSVPHGVREIADLQNSFYENQVKSIPYGVNGALVIVPMAESAALPHSLFLHQANWQAEYDTIRRSELFSLAMTAGIELLFLIALSISLMHLVMRPVRRLRRMAESGLEAGGLPPDEVTLPSILIGELDDLGLSLTQMLNQIRTQQTRLDENNRMLEDTVDERTRQLQRRNTELITLNRISHIALESPSLPDAYQATVIMISTATRYPIVAIERFDSEHEIMILEAATGMDLSGRSAAWETPIGQSLSGIAARTGKPVVEVGEMDIHGQTGIGAQTFVAIPMLSNQRVVGVLSLASPEKQIVDQQNLEWFTTLANQIVAFTGRARAEIDLKEKDERLRLALEGAEQDIWDMNLQSQRIRVGPMWAAMMGLPNGETEMDISEWEAFMLAEDRPRVRAIMQQAVQEHRAARLEYRTVLRNGEVRWIRSRGRVVNWDASGRPQRAVGIFHDITALKELEIERDRLLESESEQRELAQALREIGVVLTATLDLDTVLDQVLTQLPKLIPCDVASLLMVEGDQVRVGRVRAYGRHAQKISAATLGRLMNLSEMHNLRWIVENKRPLLIPDTMADPTWTQVKDVDYIFSWACAPIQVQGRVVALLSLDKSETNFFQPRHLELLSALAAQAGLALQNAQLFGETIDLLERERRLNEVISTLSSALDLPTILRNLVRLAVELVGADAGALGMVDEDTNQMTYPYLFNLPEATSALTEAPGSSLAWQIWQTGQSVVLDDYSSDPRSRPEWLEAGVHTFIGVPIVSGLERVGALGIFSYDAHNRFTVRELALAESVARQAGLAIQNARLYTDVRRQAEESETLRQAASAVISALDLNQVLERILIHMQRVLPYHSASIFLQETGGMRLVAGAGHPHPEMLYGRLFPTENELFQELFRTRRPIILEDARSDRRYAGWGEVSYTHGWLCVPLIVRGGIIGCVSLDSTEIGAYDDRDAHLLQAFSNEAAIAIENARLFQQVRQMAITDPLTGLYNRRHFFEAARVEFERSRRYQHKLALIMMDVDFFKQVNDRHGHMVGDAVLLAVARLFHEKMREVDLVARYGGEEFVILLPETDTENAIQVAERLRLALLEPILRQNGLEVTISISFGIADAKDAADLKSLIHHADEALYSTKATQRGMVTAWASSASQVDPSPSAGGDA